MTGCDKHGISEQRVADLQARAADTMGGHVGQCVCCGGPSPMRRVATPAGEPMQWVGFPFCRTCSEGMAYIEQVEAAHGLSLAGAYANAAGEVTRVQGAARVPVAV